MSFAEIFLADIPASIAVVGLCCYFVGMAATFMISPKKYGEKFSVVPKDAAGVTEIRVYYGGISLALAIFLAFLFFKGYPDFALVGGLIFATTVFTTRTAFTFVDKGWKCAYTKLAIPAEGAFVAALWLCFIFSKIYF